MTAASRSGAQAPREDGNDLAGSPEPPGTLVFLCGADMHPSQIKGRAGFERARFVAIARMEGSHAGQAGLPPSLGSGEIWGIALRVEPGDATAETVSIVLRDGTTAEATLMTDSTTAGSVVGVLAEAHYWELPVAYRDRLQALL